jgi:tRNA A-37 threonylcarbamoyl transferase component Bud32
MWRDNNGDLWLFGGYGYGESAGLGQLNDLWKYSYTLGTWTWVGGSKVINQKGNFSNAAPVTPQSDDEPEAVLSPSTDTPNAQTNTPVNPPVFPSETDQILLGVLLSVGLGGVGLVVLIVMLKKRKKQKKQKQNATKQPSDYVNGTQEIRQSFVDHYANVNAPNSDDRYAAINGNQGAIDAVPLDTLVMNDANSRLIPHKAITLEKEIGVGSYGKVYLGKLRTTKVAVKVANTKISQEDFVKEASFQLAIHPHPNIVQLLGISVDGPQPLVVLEYCNEGSLDKLLFETDKLSTPTEQIALAEAIARGLDHLHQNNIVHRDLAVRNVLLHHGEPKISDFGMSRKLKEASQVGKTAANIGPIRWMAPEALGKQLYSTKSDVWTFGLVLYEIVARQEPHASDDLFNVGLKIRDEGYTPEVPKTCPPVLHQIMQMCWKVDPEQRPEMSTICELLDQK